MIETNIANEIWNLKYRFEGETEEGFYKRVVNALFKDVPVAKIRAYAKIVGYETPEEFLEFTESLFSQHKLMLAGRAMHALGTARSNQTFSNCFVLPIKQDSLRAIMATANEAAMTMKAGGGIGYSFSILRPKDDVINSTGSVTTGVLSFMKVFDSVCETIKAGGNRRGAQMAALGIWHPEALDFIQCKRDGSFKNFNLSLFIPDTFMQAVENDEDWNFIFPKTNHEAYDKEWDGNILEWLGKGYPVKTYATMKAREVFNIIMKSNYNFAEPGILFEDTINKDNSLNHLEYIQVCNPCGEQPLAPYASCNLGALNFFNFVKNKFDNDAHIDMHALQKATMTGIILLNRLLDVNFYPLDAQRTEVETKRAIGLGFTGLADMIFAMCSKYSESSSFIGDLCEYILNWSFQASAKLAEIDGPFPLWSQKVEDNILRRGLQDETVELIKKYGMRNSRTLTVAPTGTISLLMNNVSSGIEPMFAYEYERKVLQNDGTHKKELIEDFAWRIYKQKFNTKKIPDYMETAQDLPVEAHLKMQSAVQQWIDSSISKTINVPVDYSFDDFKNIYMDGWKLGLKGCTTYRPNSIIGSVLEVKQETKEEKKSIRKQQREFYDIFKEHEDDKVILQDVSLPDEYEMHGYKIKSEGKKYYFHVCFKDKQKTRPFAVFVQSNHSEPDVNTYNAREMLVQLAINSNIPDNVIEQTLDRSRGQNNITKIARLLSMLLRHNVQINMIVKCLDAVDVPVSSFIFRMKKFLMQFIEEIDGNGMPCPECGEPVIYRDGCISCPSCNWSKCA